MALLKKIKWNLPLNWWSEDTECSRYLHFISKWRLWLWFFPMMFEAEQEYSPPFSLWIFWRTTSQWVAECLPFITWMAKLLPEIIIPLSLSWNTFRFWELQRKIERKVQNMKNICFRMITSLHYDAKLLIDTVGCYWSWNRKFLLSKNIATSKNKRWRFSPLFCWHKLNMIIIKYKHETEITILYTHKHSK